MKTKLLIIVSFFIIFLCCQQEIERGDHSLFINCLIGEYLQNNNTSLYNDIIIFCKVNRKDKLGYIGIDRLQILFNRDSSYIKMRYPTFIKNVICQSITLDEKEVEGIFIPSDRIISECGKKSFSEFLAIYADCTYNNRCAVIRKNLSLNEEMTVLYCLYQHNYYSGFDDVTGLYFSEKIDFILKRKTEKIDIKLE